MKNSEIASVFNNIADLLEIKGDNPFRVRAYRKAAFTISTLGQDVASLSRDELLRIPGIGRDLAGKIEEYVGTGRLGMYETLKEEVPESLVTLLGIPGMGPKTVSLLFKQYGVRDVDQLERIAREHKLSGIPGIREKTEANIIKGIEMIRRYSSRHPIGDVLPVAHEIREHLLKSVPLERIEIAGSLRRWKETIRDIDLIAVSGEPEKVMHAFAHMPFVKQIVAKGPTKSSVLTQDGIQVDIRVVDGGSFGSALAYFTGSKAHNIRLREIASRAGLKINEYGIFREKDDRKLGGRDEEDIYRVLGLPFVQPELREDLGEIEAAQENRLPSLVELTDIRGDLHAHSKWSDGALDIGEMIGAPMSMGYQYLAVTDHSKGLGVARGLSEERLLEQVAIIRAMNRTVKRFRILAGVEVDIRNDGSLDFDDEILRQLDIVVASIHSGFKQPGSQITGRLLRAIRNPYVSIIAHPSGRIIGEREGYDLDMESVIQAAAETGTAIEINAYPRRLDLTESNVRLAKARGVPIVISTDAHNPGQFGSMVYGVAVARRGWLEKKDVLNTLPVTAFLKKIRKRTVPAAR